MKLSQSQKKKEKKRGAEVGEKYGTIALEQSEQISGPV